MIFFKKVGNHVYKDIKDHIKKGNIKMLAKHWQHFFDRKMLIIIFPLMMKKLF